MPVQINYCQSHRTPESNYFMFVTWNVYTLSNSDTSERRTALIDKKFQLINADIVALSEARFLCEGYIKEECYLLYWKDYSEELMTLRYPIATGLFVNVISVYTLTLDAN